jgi:hypothetical protein
MKLVSLFILTIAVTLSQACSRDEKSEDPGDHEIRNESAGERHQVDAPCGQAPAGFVLDSEHYRPDRAVALSTVDAAGHQELGKWTDYPVLNNGALDVPKTERLVRVEFRDLTLYHPTRKGNLDLRLWIDGREYVFTIDAAATNVEEFACAVVVVDSATETAKLNLGDIELTAAGRNEPRGQYLQLMPRPLFNPDAAVQEYQVSVKDVIVREIFTEKPAALDLEAPVYMHGYFDRSDFSVDIANMDGMPIVPANYLETLLSHLKAAGIKVLSGMELDEDIHVKKYYDRCAEGRRVNGEARLIDGYGTEAGACERGRQGVLERLKAEDPTTFEVICISEPFDDGSAMMSLHLTIKDCAAG